MPTRKEPAQILVLFAVFIVVLMVLAGSAYDYASIVVDDARLQNAVDCRRPGRLERAERQCRTGPAARPSRSPRRPPAPTCRPTA